MKNICFFYAALVLGLINKWLKAFGLVAILFCTSCQDKEGCTDEYSLNFDVDANIDDGSCEYHSTEFIGEYDAVQDCEASSSVNYNLTITLDPNSISEFPHINTSVIIDSEQLPMAKAQILDFGTSGNPLMILESQNINVPVLGDVSIIGEAHLSDDNILTLKIWRDYLNNPSNPGAERCTIIATKK